MTLHAAVTHIELHFQSSLCLVSTFLSSDCLPILRRLVAADSLTRSLKQEKESLIAEHLKKEETMRKTQRQQMENVMNLQEENDNLRHAVR